uniref:Uncharacterized protein n=1 Tax=Tetranychus urticae TaxID=32264 RepID=T1KJY0_TETUR
MEGFSAYLPLKSSDNVNDDDKCKLSQLLVRISPLITTIGTHFHS